MLGLIIQLLGWKVQLARLSVGRLKPRWTPSPDTIPMPSQAEPQSTDHTLPHAWYPVWEHQVENKNSFFTPSCCSDSKKMTVTAYISETAFEHFCLLSVFNKKSLPFEILQKYVFSLMSHR